MTRIAQLVFIFVCLVAASNDAVTDEQPGLIGIQYGSGDFQRPQRLVKLDSLEQRWGEQDRFGSEWSGRWQGSLVGPANSQIRLVVEADDQANIKIGDDIVLKTSKGTSSAQFPVIEGKKYPIELTYVKDAGGPDSKLRIRWSWGNQGLRPITAEHLSHSDDQANLAKAEHARGEQSDDDSGDDEQRREFASDKGVDFHRRAGEMDITVDGKYFATYVWSDRKTTRPYFKQIHALGGEVLISREHPPKAPDYTDHETYHPGIWWGFGDVGGNDYWRMKARIVGGTFIEEPTGNDESGSFAVRNRLYTNDGAEIFCDQVCRYTFLKQDDGVLMICESIFTREQSDFWLGDQEEMGLAFRVTKSICVDAGEGGTICDSAGRRDLKRIRTNQSDWCDYSGPVADRHGGIMLMNDPANFRKPWWHAVDTGLLVANAFGESELSGGGKKRENVLVRKGQPFRLRYGLLVHLHDRAGEFYPARAYKEFLDNLKKVDVPEDDVPEDKASASMEELPRVPAGFKISVFASEPQVYKPTAICFDAKGRLMVGQGPQYPRNRKDTPPDSVVIMIDSDDDGVVDATKAFATGFNSVQGLAWKGDALYVANAPELTVVRDLDGDDEADEYTVIYTDLGNREHALHGLTFAPDGKLYMSKGNSKGHNQPEKYGYVAPKPFRELWDVVHPAGAPDSYAPKTYTKHNYKKSYHHWDDDWGREGGVLRCDPTGEGLEIVSRGMRNPWDITMDDGFNWLGTDNDQDQGDRLIMPFHGAHFGWGHNYSSHWTGEGHLPTAPISGPVFPGSGTGVVYYAHHHLPGPYRNIFFVNDWLQGTFVYRPAWDGALMQPANGRWEPFATRGNGNMLYRPTDLEFAPDGSIYICGWGGDYHYDRQREGSWLFRLTHSGQTPPMRSEWFPAKRSKPYVDWTVDQLLADLGPDIIPVWRVNAQDELVRRGERVRNELAAAIETGDLTQGQQTWTIWAIGRMSSENKSIDDYFAKLATPNTNPDSGTGTPLNLRIQALRILAYRARLNSGTNLSADVIKANLNDPEPRVRLEAVQAIWQANQVQHLEAVVERLATEQDRLVFYAGWQAIRELTDADYRKQLLSDARPAVRLAALLSLQERHEISLDEVLHAAENDPDERVQAWAMTWAMNPQPPKKMPNTTSRIELEESVSLRDLIKRAREAKTPKLRRLYLTMISRATYRGGDDWNRLRELYDKLQTDDERSLVLTPLARQPSARPLLWNALAGGGTLQQSAVRGFATLARQSGSSPEEVADYLLQQVAKVGQVDWAFDALDRLEIPKGWRPDGDWDNTLASAFEQATDIQTRRKILSLLLAVEPSELAKTSRLKQVLADASAAPPPQLYASLLELHPRLGIGVQMKPPKLASVEAVLKTLPNANVIRGRELFFGKSGATSCAACHRISGRGNNLAPDLSGIGLRANPDKIAQSIVLPSAVITEGYQRQIVVTRDGLSYAGAVLSGGGSHLRLVKTDGTIETIDALSIESREKTKQSAMPDNFALLGDEQVADLVAYLVTCRQGVAIAD